MRRYTRLWRAVWSSAAALGVGLAGLEWSWRGTLLVLGLLFLLCLLVGLVLPEELPWVVRTRRRFSVGHAFTAAVAILALLAVSRVSPPLALLVVLAAGLSSPAVVRRAARSARRSPPDPRLRPPEPQAETEPVDEEEDDGYRLTLHESMGPLRGLDDQQLCRLWRESFWLLLAPAPPGTVLCLVALREACLDELERRDADALHAWLDSGARASSGPEKYMHHPRRPGSEAA